MEVLLIDRPKNANPNVIEVHKVQVIHHAGRRRRDGIGFSPSQVADESSLRPSRPAPNPFRFLVSRALGNNDHHAGTSGAYLLREPPTQDETSFPPLSPRCPAPNHRAGKAGSVSEGFPVGADTDSRVIPTAPDSLNHHAEEDGHRVDTSVVRVHPKPPNARVPSDASSAPTYCIDNGSPITLDRNAGAVGTTRPEISPLGTGILSSPHSPAPSDNVGQETLDRSPGASSPNIPFTLKSVLSGILDKILDHSAYRARPDLIRTNFGWQRREDFEKHR